MSKKRANLIKKYEKLHTKYELFDIWDDDIFPILHTLTDEEIKERYEEDKAYYDDRYGENAVYN